MTITRRTAALSTAAVVAGLIGVPLATATGASADSGTEATFGFSSGYQSWTVPAGVNSVSISVAGGAGGDGAVVDSTCPDATSGEAGWVTGTVPVTPGQVLSLWVGDGGHLSGAGGSGTPDGTWAGGAGGTPGFGFTVTGGAGNGGGGGGASVVWSDTGHGDDQILLVGGGGGGGGGEGPAAYECGGRGGNGGQPPAAGGTPDQSSVSLGGAAGLRAGSDHSGVAGVSAQSFGAGGGGGGAGIDVGGGGRTDESASGTAGGGGGGASFARDGVVSDTFFSSSGAHGQKGSIRITWGAPTSVSIGSGVADVGNTVLLRALVDPTDGGGTVAFTSDGVAIPGCEALPFSSGGGTTWQATCSTSSLPAGVHEIAATYSGDTAYAGSANSGFWTVRQPTTTTVATTPASPVTSGNTLTLTALIGQAYGGGSVQFTLDGTTVPGCNAVAVRHVSGTYSATCSTTAPSPGTYTVGAQFAGDSIDYPSSGTTSLDVQAAGSPIGLGSQPNVPGAPTLGTVQAGDGSAVVEFTPPSSDGGAGITGYLVVATPVSGGTPVSDTATASPFTLSGLTDRTAYTVTVAATNVAGTGPASAPSAPFTPLAPLAITTGSPLPSGTVGTPYTATLATSGGTGNVTWTLAPGSSLPLGLTLNPDGSITGTPTVVVSAQPVGVHAADASGQTADTQLALTVVASPTAADLRVSLDRAGTFRRGTTDSVLVRVANTGTAGTQGVMTAKLTLPAGVTPTSASGRDWTCTRQGQVVTCTRTKTLWARQTSTVTVRVHVTAPSGLTLAILAAVGPDDATPADNAVTGSIRIG